MLLAHLAGETIIEEGGGGPVYKTDVYIIMHFTNHKNEIKMLCAFNTSS